MSLGGTTNPPIEVVRNPCAMETNACVTISYEFLVDNDQFLPLDARPDAAALASAPGEQG